MLFAQRKRDQDQRVFNHFIVLPPASHCMSLATPNGLNGQKETELGYACGSEVRCMSANIPLVADNSDLRPVQNGDGAAVPNEVGRYGQHTFGREQAIVPAWPWRQVSIRILVPCADGVEWLVFMWSHLFLSLLSMTFYGFRAFVCFCTQGSSTHRSWDELLLATSTPFGS